MRQSLLPLCNTGLKSIIFYLKTILYQWKKKKQPFFTQQHLLWCNRWSGKENNYSRAAAVACSAVTHNYMNPNSTFFVQSLKCMQFIVFSSLLCTCGHFMWIGKNKYIYLNGAQNNKKQSCIIYSWESSQLHTVRALLQYHFTPTLMWQNEEQPAWTPMMYAGGFYMVFNVL